MPTGLPPHLFATLLAATLPLSADGQAQLLPAGQFAARDGRPGPGKTYQVSNAQGAKLAGEINAVAARTQIVIDYDHQTIHGVTNGQPAPAAGWIKSAAWRDDVGLFASVDWTPRAKTYIDGREYRFISPVLTHDDDGHVTGVLLAALVNYPALTGMEPVVAALSTLFPPAQKPELSMNLLATLIARLGLPATTDDAAALSAVETLKAAADAAKSKPLVPTALSAALGLQAGHDEAAALSAVDALKAGGATVVSTMQAMHAQIAALSAQLGQKTLEDVVDGAIVAHKLLPAQREWALGLGKTNMAALQGYLGTAVAIPGLGGQGGGKGPGDDADTTAALSAVQLALAAQLGITPEKYAAQLKADKAATKAA